MSELLAKVIDAHGGMDRWKSYQQVDATIVSGGGFSRSRASRRTPTHAA
jgi:hypothetical protein